MGGRDASHTWLLYLGDDECDDLLASTTLGRLAVIGDGRPEIFPVNHVFDRTTRAVLFLTNHGTKVHSALHWSAVAYEIDGVDDAAGEGWSVLVVGRAEVVGEPDVVAFAEPRRQAPWSLGGVDAVWLRIVPEKITGRRIGAPERQA